MKLIIILFILLCIPVCAADAETDLGAEMVEQGINQTIIGLANDIYSMGITDSADSTTMIHVAAYTMDPYKIPAVKETNVIITDLFYCFFIMIIFIHGGVLLLTRYMPEKLDAFEFVTVDFNGYHYSSYVTKMMKGIFILALAHFSIQLILEIEQWLTVSLLQNVPGSIEPTPDNVVLYAMMSLIWLSLLVFFIIRTFIIALFAAFALGVGILYLIGPTEHIAIMLWKYFLALTFMQPIIVGVSCLVVRMIKESKSALDMGWVLDSSVEVVQYFGLMIILFVICFIIVFGPALEALFRVATRKVF